jgi:membrane-associated phospholipid phosphatase
MNKFATIISRVFDPFIMLAVVFIVLLSHSQIFFPAFIGMVVVPLALYAIAVQTKFVSDWDLRDRRERPKIIWPLVGIETSCLILFHLWLLTPILVSIIGFAVITHFWKISGHAMAAGLATGVCVITYGWVWWPVLLVVPLVGWSRVVRKNHTLLQVIAGALYAWIWVGIFSAIS